jgi:hypothetical protein
MVTKLHLLTLSAPIVADNPLLVKSFGELFFEPKRAGRVDKIAVMVLDYKVRYLLLERKG